jgi:hypothetical protein
MLQTVVAIHMLYLRMKVCWSDTFFTQKLEDAVSCLPERIHESPAVSNTLLCRDHTEQPAYEMRILWLVVTTFGWQKND